MSTPAKNNYPKQAPWEKRLNNKIESLRRDIGIVTQSQKPHPSRKVVKAATTIINRLRTNENPTTTDILDLLKQKLAAMSKRLRRYRESNTRRTHNQQFARSERIFYNNLNNSAAPNHTEVKLPTPEVIREFWENIWGTPVLHKRTKWLHDERRATANLQTMLAWEITQEEVESAINKTHNWKAPGMDKIQNFWYKQFKATHQQLTKCYTILLAHPESIPNFMMSGVTYLLPKTPQYTENPAKYRPITCLPTIYKLITSIISEKVYSHLERNKLLDEEQKGCRKRSRGCKEQLIIDATIMSNAQSTKSSLHTAYIDYQKAFDSIPHSWLLEVLELYGIENHIYLFLKNAMNHWNTKLLIKAPNETLDVGTINIKRGIFQGDSLSPIWFCLALRPLTKLLNCQRKGYRLPQSNQDISHLWYMDDLKLYAQSKKHLQDLLTCVGQFSTNIHMTFGLDKCKISSMERGKWVQHEGFLVNEDQGTIEGMGEEEKYKYLGYLQARNIDHKLAKQTSADIYLKRVRLILRTKLSARNIAKAINTYATSAISYSFGIIQWTTTELNDLNIKTRKEFRKHRAHHPRSSIERFHLPRKMGGRGIPDIKIRHHKQLDNLRTYFYKKAETSNLHLAVTRADKKATPLRLAQRTFDPIGETETFQQQLQQWRSKPLHGKYLATIEHDSVDTFASTTFLRRGNIFPETEGFIAAIQDQVIPTKAYKQRIMGEHVQNIKCRLCNAKEETLDHIIGGCTTLAPKAYLDRHNRVGKIIHQKIREKFMGITETVPYYLYEPMAVCENDDVRIYWNRKIQTDRPIPNNIPDLVLTLKEQKKTFIVDFAVPLPANLNRTHADKISKYLPLRDEILQMWRMESVRIVPIVIGATGEIPTNFKTSMAQLDLDWELYIPIQKSVLLDTCSIVRRAIGEQVF